MLRILRFQQRFLLVVVVVLAVLLSTSIWITSRSIPGAQDRATQPEAQIAATEAKMIAPPIAVPQNGEVRVSVYDFLPNELLVFSIDAAQGGGRREIGRAKADQEGRVAELTIRLPESVTSGAWTLAAEGQSSGRRAITTVYVRAESPWITLGSYAAKQDGTLALAAGGFEPGERVKVFLESDPQRFLSLPSTDAAGNTEWLEISLRGLRAGQHNLVLIGENSGIRMSEMITIAPRAPWVRLHVYTIGPGGSIGFDGHDFAPGEKVQVFLDEVTGQPIQTVVADGSGNFSVDQAHTAKPSDVGKHRVIFAGELTQSIAVAFEVVPYTPAFQMTNYAGPPGTETSFNGYGFAPGERVKVFLDGSEQPVAIIQVDENGAFEDAGRFMVPRTAAGGDLGVTLVGEASGVRLRQSFSVVRVQPFLGLDVYAGPPGQTVTFNGIGFAARENVRVHLGNNRGPTVATATTDADGRFPRSMPAAVPSDATSDVTFTAVGEESGIEASVRFQVILPSHER